MQLPSVLQVLSMSDSWARREAWGTSRAGNGASGPLRAKEHGCGLHGHKLGFWLCVCGCFEDTIMRLCDGDGVEIEVGILSPGKGPVSRL